MSHEKEEPNHLGCKVLLFRGPNTRYTWSCSEAQNVSVWKILVTRYYNSFFVIVDHYFVVLSPICIGFLPYFCWLFAFVFSLGCVYLCFWLPCTGFPSLICFIQGCSSTTTTALIQHQCFVSIFEISFFALVFVN